MKSRKEFLADFFDRLTQRGFRVEPVSDSDLAAEVYIENTPFCVVTQDGEIIYEAYDGEKARTLEQAAAESRKELDCHVTPPFSGVEEMETVTLVGGAYAKVFESTGVVLLCRRTSLYGYEFVTCQKAPVKHNSRRFYREQYYYEPQAAQHSFMERSGLSLQGTVQFTPAELRVLVSCCARCVMLDNELDAENQKRIHSLMKRMEDTLPPQQELSPRHCYQNEIS